MFYRIEKDGIGPYRHINYFPEQELGVEKWMDKTHLAHQVSLPDLDPVLGAIYFFIQMTSDKFPKDLIFCFNSEEELLNCFSQDELWKLKILGFDVKEYSEQDYHCLKGKTQSVIFKTQESYDYYLEILNKQAQLGFIPMY